ncbi:ATP-binding protein [Peribacillus loiseleuriae]|uniref:ATP-binding protein n=1 Tax=Peribacillus loiseleuriae TaxID=1679170 RepID=UPI003D090525
MNFFPIKSPYISILDNGIGINRTELIKSMRYGSSNPLDERATNDLGRFGLGMKTASMSQCRKLTVVSKKDNEVVGAQWDLDHVETTQKWSLRVLEENDFNNIPHIEKFFSGIFSNLSPLRIFVL